MKLSLPTALFQLLSRHGIQQLVTVPGSQTVPILDAARTQDNVNLVVATNELSGAFIACGIAAASKKPGVLLTIPGPGFLFSVPGIAEADADSIPLLVIVVRPRKVNAAFALHDLDHKGIASSLLRGHFSISEPGELLTQLESALRATTENEPGPVLLKIAQELLSTSLEALPLPTAKAELAPSEFGNKLGESIANSSRPLIFLGKGASAAFSELRQLIENAHIPVFSTASGRGVIADKDPLCFSTDFSSGLGTVIPELVSEADRIIVIGAKLTHNGTAGFALKLPQEKLIRIDCSTAITQANYPADAVFIVKSDQQLRDVVSSAREFITKLHYRSAWNSSYLEKLRHLREQQNASRLPSEPLVDCSELRELGEFFRELQNALPNDSVYVCDSGFHQALSRQHLRTQHPGTLIIPADLQTMGFGLSTAIGFGLAAPTRQVVAIIGDGGLCSTGLELLTTKNRSLSLLVVLLDDGAYGLIRKQLLKESGSANLAARVGPKWEVFCNALGINYFELAAENELEILQAAVRQQGVRLLRVPLTDSLKTTISAAGAEIKDKLRQLTRKNR